MGFKENDYSTVIRQADEIRNLKTQLAERDAEIEALTTNGIAIEVELREKLKAHEKREAAYLAFVEAVKKACKEKHDDEVIYGVTVALHELKARERLREVASES